MNSPDQFRANAEAAFAFLVHDFGMQVTSTDVYVNEWSVTYLNTTTGVTIKLEPGSRPWVELSRLSMFRGKLVEHERYDLMFLLAERGVDATLRRELINADDAAAALYELANYLRIHAAEILRGDFGVFPRLRKRAEENLRRTNQELYGSDQ